MAFVINVIKYVNSRDYVLSGIYYSVLVRNTCQNSQQTRRWPNAGPPSATLAQHQTSTGWTPCVSWEPRSIAGLVLIDTAGNDYKLTPTQFMLNVGPESPELASIHSVLVSTSFWGTCMVFLNLFSDFIYIYIHSRPTYNIYSTEQKKKTIRETW